jgi:hypothetical protein
VRCYQTDTDENRHGKSQYWYGLYAGNTRVNSHLDGMKKLLERVEKPCEGLNF